MEQANRGLVHAYDGRRTMSSHDADLEADPAGDGIVTPDPMRRDRNTGHFEAKHVARWIRRVRGRFPMFDGP